MCFAGLFKAPAPPPVIPAPSKTSADVQAGEERIRGALALSSRGFASTILTSGSGDTSTPKLSGVTLGT